MEAIDEAVELLMALPDGGKEVVLLHDCETHIRDLQQMREEDNISEDAISELSLPPKERDFRRQSSKRATLLQSENKQKADRAKAEEDEFFQELNRLEDLLEKQPLPNADEELESLKTGLGEIKQRYEISPFVYAYTDTIAESQQGTEAMLKAFEAEIPVSVHQNSARESIPPEKLTPAQFGLGAGSYMDNKTRVADIYESKEQRKKRIEAAAAAEMEAILGAIKSEHGITSRTK